MARLASISSIRRSEVGPAALPPPCPSGRAGKQMASAQLGSHHDVAVLHAGVELDLAARAPAEGGVERADDLGGLVGRRVPAGEVDHRAVAADGDQVAAVGDLVGPQLQTERSGLDGRVSVW